MDECAHLALHRHAAVQQAIVDVLNEVDNRIRDESIWERLCLEPAQSCVRSIVEALCAAHLSRDIVTRDVLSQRCWQPDVEPSASEPDTWIRGAVPRRPSRPSVTPSEATKPHKAPGGVAAVVRPTGTPLSKHGSRPLSAASLSQQNAKRPVLVTLQKQAVASAPLSTGSLLAKRVSTQELEERLRDELDIRRRQAQKLKEAAQKAAEDAHKLETLRKSLRGSEYTLDHRGQVVPLQRFDPDALPPLSTVPGVRLATPPEKPEKKATRARAAPDADGVKTGRPKYAPTLDGPDFVEQQGSTQPSILDVITLNPGCAIRQGAAERKGPPVVGQMTRTDFLQMKAGKVARGAPANGPPHDPRAACTTPVPATGSSSPVQNPPGSRKGSLDQPGSPPRDTPSKARQNITSSLAAVSFRETPTNERRNLISTSGAVSFRREWDTDAQKGTFTAPQLSKLVSGRQADRQASHKGYQDKGAVNARPTSPDPNLALISASDWGFSSSGKSAAAASQPPLPITLLQGKVERQIMMRERAPPQQRRL